MNCVLCWNEIKGYGHSADPFKGKCCDDCHPFVLKTRIQNLESMLELYTKGENENE
tara:strand:- start:292 stop:459 length:168 start_codon:yes stop_codon:yes gene_type:complete